MARGLAAAHARGIVHGDLKPENIFLGIDGRVKILDFGLATLHGPLRRGARPRTGTAAPRPVFGTVGYMAPEQMRGERADGRTDIFALGVVAARDDRRPAAVRRRAGRGPVERILPDVARSRPTRHASRAGRPGRIAVCARPLTCARRVDALIAASRRTPEARRLAGLLRRADLWWRVPCC